MAGALLTLACGAPEAPPELAICLATLPPGAAGEVERTRLEAARGRLEALLGAGAGPEREAAPDGEAPKVTPAGRSGLTLRGAEVQKVAAEAGDLGVAYFAYGFAAPAEACLEAAAALAPETGRWPYYLGFSRQVRGDYSAAAESFSEAIGRGLDEPAARLRRARSLLELGRLDEARRELERLLESQPPLAAAARESLARIALEQGEPATAASHLEVALAAQPEATALHHLMARARRELGDETRARDHLARAGSAPVSFPDPLVEALDAARPGGGLRLARAGVALAQGRLDEALAELRIAVAESPDDAEARRLYGEALTARGDLEAAAEELAAGLELAPGDPSLLVASGRLRSLEGDAEGAVELLERAVERAPDWGEARLELARALAAAGRREAATAAYDALLSREPGRLEAAVERTGLRLAAGDAAAAATELEALAAAHPDAPELALRLGEARQRAGDLAEALAAYERALDAGLPADREAVAHLSAGNLRAAAGESDRAEAHYRSALALDPQLAPARRNLAGLLARGGRHAEAVEEIRRLLTVADPSEKAELHLDLASGLLALGRASEAHAEVAAARAAGASGARAPLVEAEALGRLGRWDEVGRVLEAATAGGAPEGPGGRALRHALARLLASAPDRTVRDGARAAALALALQAEAPSPVHAETVAMALAEAGRFEEAAAWQREVIDQALAAGTPPEALTALRANLARYERGKSCCGPQE